MTQYLSPIQALYLSFAAFAFGLSFIAFVAGIASKISRPRLVATPLPAIPASFAPANYGNGIDFAQGYYLAARAARNVLTLEDFFFLAFGKAPSATPASFAALTPKQIATRRGQQHKFHNKVSAIRASISI